MRLDEWQKYIDTQFLDDEPEPTPALKPVSPATPTLSDYLSEELLVSEELPAAAGSVGKEIGQATPAIQATPDATEQAASAVPEAVQATPLPEPVAPPARPETAPNSIQNIVTMVVAPPIPPETTPLPVRPPRIELLTPLPDQTSNAPRPEPQPEVINRTRRRSQSSNGSSENNNHRDTEETNASTRDMAQVQKRTLFHPLEDLDADIPSFASYLPSQNTPLPEPTKDAVLTTPETPSLFAEELATPDTASNALPQEEESASESLGSRRVPRSRARHARNVRPENVPSGLSAAELWATVPRHVQTLLALERLEEEQEVAQSSYKRPFQETRHELIERLLDPILSLEDTARLLNVCPTTVRRYTNKGILTYYRKEPERTTRANDGDAASQEKETRQRRFRLSDILAFLETQQVALAADRQAERRLLSRASDNAITNGKDH